MKRNWWAAAVVVVLTLVAGCNSNGKAQNSTEMRTLNAVVDAEALDVLVDDDVKLSALATGATSPYADFSSGGRDVKVRSATNQAVLLDKTLSFGSGATSTLVLYGKRAAMGALVLADDTTSPSSGKFKVRAIGLSPDAGPVDLYLATGDISSTPATLSTVGYAATTDYAEVAAGNYQFILTAAGTKDVVFQSAQQGLAEGSLLTLAVFPAIGGKLVNAVLLKAGSGASGTFLPNPYGRMKAVNAVPDAPGLNFKADGATLLSNVPFTGTSSYVTTASGAHALQLEASNVPGPTIATLAAQLEPAKDYSAVAVNPLGQVQLVALADDNTLPVAGFAKLRFANMLVDGGSVDVLVNFASQASGVAYKGASGYSQLVAATNYTITFATPGGISVIAALSPVELVTGAVYTAYVFGSAANPQARLVRDR
jgi:outer membrane murein-binding lipoprotein Lpp